MDMSGCPLGWRGSCVLQIDQQTPLAIVGRACSGKTVELYPVKRNVGTQLLYFGVSARTPNESSDDRVSRDKKQSSQAHPVLWLFPVAFLWFITFSWGLYALAHRRFLTLLLIAVTIGTFRNRVLWLNGFRFLS